MRRRGIVHSLVGSSSEKETADCRWNHMHCEPGGEEARRGMVCVLLIGET